MNLRKSFVTIIMAAVLIIVQCSCVYAQKIEDGLFMTLDGLKVYVDNEKFTEVSDDIQALSLDQNDIGKTVSFKLVTIDNAELSAKQNNIKNIYYKCSAMIKNDDGEYEVVDKQDITLGKLRRYEFKINGAGSYKFLFEEYQDGVFIPNNYEYYAVATDDKNPDSQIKQIDTNKNSEIEKTEINSVKINKGIIRGKCNRKNAKIKVKVGSKDYKKAKVNGKKFMFTSKGIKKGVAVKIKISIGDKWYKRTYRF